MQAVHAFLAQLRPPDYEVPLPGWLRTARLWVHYTLALLATLIVGFMMLSVNYLVFMRYVVRQPPAWVVELNSYLLVFLTFLTIPWIMAFNEHIRIDVMAEFLSKKRNLVVELLTSVATIAFLLFMAMLTTERAWIAFAQKQEFVGAIVLSKLPFFAVIPIGFVLMACETMLKLADDLYRLQHLSSTAPVAAGPSNA